MMNRFPFFLGVFLFSIISLSVYIVMIDIEANAESYRGYDYFITTNQDGSISKTIGLPPFIWNNQTNSYTEFIQYDTTIQTNFGSVKLNGDTFYYYPNGLINENSTAKFNDKIVAKYADITNLNSWTYPNQLNNAESSNSWNGTALTSSKLNSNIGLLEYKYILNDGSWKTQLEATNLSTLETKAFGFDQIIDLNTDSIKFGGVVRNLDNFDGQTFSKQFLDENKGKVLDLMNGYYFDFDLAYEYLHSVKVIDTGENSTRLIFDFRTDFVLMPNETLVLDPNYGGIDQNSYLRIFDNSGNAVTTCDETGFTSSTTGNIKTSYRDSSLTTNPVCELSIITFDTTDFTDLPSNYNINSIILGFDVDTETNARNVDIGKITSDPSTDTLSTLWQDIIDDANYASNNAEFVGVANGKSVTLGGSSVSDFETALSNNDEFHVGLSHTSHSRDGSFHSQDYSDFTLTINYDLPPDPPKQTEATISAPDISFEWLAGELNGDTHSSYDMELYNGTDWNQVFTQSGVDKTFTPTTFFNDTSKYRLWDTGSLGRGCPQFVMNSTIVANLTSHYPLCYTTNDNGILDNDGTVTGDELYDNSTGTVYFDFDGSSYVQLPNESDYDFEATDTFSICAEFQTTQSATGYIVSKNHVPFNVVGYGFYTNSGKVSFSYWAGSSGTMTKTTQTTTLNNDNLQHVCFTNDGSDTLSGMEIYVNGTADGDSGSDTKTNTSLNNQQPTIGARSDAANYFTGQIKDVLILDKELDANEVEQLYLERIDTHNILAPPTNLSTNVISDSQIDLSWDAPTYDYDGFKIERESPTGGGFSTLVADTGNTDLTYSDTGLVFGTQYNYRVTALNGASGVSSPSNESSATTTSTTYTGTAPTLTVNDCYHTCTTQLNLEFPDSTLDNINGYRIQFESPVDGGFSILVNNSTTTTQYYNHTSLTAGQVYNYKVQAMNGSGVSDESNEYAYSPHKLPESVDDLTANPTSLSSVDLSWTAPTPFAPSISCYMINYTTPEGDPLTIIDACTSSTATEYEITGLALGIPNSFRVSAVTDHGTNTTSANIANATAFSEFTIGEIDIPTESSTATDIRFQRTDLNATSLSLNVIFPTGANLACDFDYEFAGINRTYTGMTSDVYETGYSNSSFVFHGISNEVVDVKCWDQDDPTVTGTYIITQTTFELIDLIEGFRDGTWGTEGQFGAIDFVTLIVIVISMIGFNRINTAAGVIINVMIIGVTGWYGIIEPPTVLFGVMALTVMVAFGSQKKND